MKQVAKIKWMNPELVNLGRSEGFGDTADCTGGSAANLCGSGGNPVVAIARLCANGDTNTFGCIAGESHSGSIDCNPGTIHSVT